MHDRRAPSTAMFLAVVVVSFVAATVTSTATSHPLEATVATAVAVADPAAPTSTTTVTVPAASPPASPPAAPNAEVLNEQVPTTVTQPPPTTEPPDVVVDAPPASAGAPSDLLVVAREALDSVVPDGWFGAGDLDWGVVEGSSTLSKNNPPTILVGRDHFDDPDKLRFVLAHEWGHQLTFRYSDPTLAQGDPPVGFDAAGNDPVEMWAGCVAEVLVPEYWASTHGLPRCPPSAKDFTAAYLAAGPS